MAPHSPDIDHQLAGPMRNDWRPPFATRQINDVEPRREGSSRHTYLFEASYSRRARAQGAHGSLDPCVAHRDGGAVCCG